MKISRDQHLVNQIIFVDGLPGAGKSLFSWLLDSFERVEKYDYTEIIEVFCELHYLNKLTLDTASAMINMFADLKLYNNMMGRQVNVRPNDESSIFAFPETKLYIDRIFSEGDASVLDKIKENKPILNFDTHHLLALSDPIFAAFGKRAYFIEVVRHPAYMIKQLYTSTMKDLINNVRYWCIHIDYKGSPIPYWVDGYEDIFIKSNDVEKAVLFINYYQQKVEKFKKIHRNDDFNIHTISFEKFVLDPDKRLDNLLKFIKTKKTKHTDKVLLKQKVPRIKTVDTLDLEIYRRVGGYSESIEGFTEKEELDLRKDWTKEKVDQKIFKLFLDLCDRYEQNIWKPVN